MEATLATLEVTTDNDTIATLELSMDNDTLAMATLEITMDNGTMAMATLELTMDAMDKGGETDGGITTWCLCSREKRRLRLRLTQHTIELTVMSAPTSTTLDTMDTSFVLTYT